MRPDQRPEDAVNAPFGGWFQMVLVAPPDNRGLEMPQIMIPRDNLGTEPGFKVFDIRHGGRPNPQEQAEVAAIACPRPALPVIGGRQGWIQIELLGDILQGDRWQLFRGARKTSFELAKLEGERDSQPTARIARWQHRQFVRRQRPIQP
jgi:hypothetical protein